MYTPTFDYTRESQPTAEQLMALPVATRQVALLDATVAFYRLGNRAQDGLTCVYHSTSTSPGCAIGRWMEKEVVCQTSDVLDPAVLPLLPAWMQEMDHKFLADTQFLHDRCSHWDVGGLSKNGAMFANTIKDAIK